LSTLIRKAVKELTLSKAKSITVEAKNVADYLGVPKFRYGEVEDQDQVGVVTGLAWTDVGGELLTIEAAMMPGKGKMIVTGNLRAASRGGMKTVLIPEENAKDLVEISESIKKGLDIVPVSRMDEVLARTLVRKPEPIEWDEEKAKPTETSVTTEPAVDADSST